MALNEVFVTWQDVIERAIERGVQSKQGNTLRYEVGASHPSLQNADRKEDAVRSG